jgi:hypothetical protein
VAHMMSAGISAQCFADWRIKWGTEFIVHSHISDLPGMHARDQIPVSWTMPDADANPDRVVAYRPYIDLLRERADGTTNGLPFTNVCALELEGCGRIDWVHRGLNWMKRLFSVP